MFSGSFVCYALPKFVYFFFCSIYCHVGGNTKNAELFNFSICDVIFQNINWNLYNVNLLLLLFVFFRSVDLKKWICELPINSILRWPFECDLKELMVFTYGFRYQISSLIQKLHDIIVCHFYDYISKSCRICSLPTFYPWTAVIFIIIFVYCP